MRDRVRAWLAAILAVGMISAWLAGFASFVNEAGRAGAADAKADGIVVLTGGAERIVTGIRLLQQGCAHVMLISGVGHGAALGELLQGTGIDPASLAPRITLGRSATSTTGNADETAAWVEDQGLHSLLVVTASYHMRRAMTELQRSLPGIALVPVPVLPPALRRPGRLSTFLLLAHEYNKWLASSLGMARIGAESGLEPG